jgi:hypothetical protein
VTITVHDGSHTPVANATVSGAWTSGGTGSCTTNPYGQCTVSTVVNVTHATLTYGAADNHDPDGDSNGTSSP